MLCWTRSSTQHWKKENIHFILVLITLAQQCTGQHPMQCCAKGSKYDWIRKNSYAIFSKYSLDNIANVKTLCNVARDAPGNIAYEKILCSFVLILLGQYCTNQSPTQCCPRCSRQHCIRKNPVQCCFNTPGTTLHRKNTIQFCPKCSRQHCIKKIMFNIVIMLLEQHCRD